MPAVHLASRFTVVLDIFNKFLAACVIIHFKPVPTFVLQKFGKVQSIKGAGSYNISHCVIE